MTRLSVIEYMTLSSERPCTFNRVLITLASAAPAGDAVVALSSSNTGAVNLAVAVVTLSSNLTSVATVPASVTVMAGNTTATFAVSTHTVSNTTTVTICGTEDNANGKPHGHAVTPGRKEHGNTIAAS